MLRALGALALAALLIALPFGSLAIFAFPIVLIFGAMFGLPLLLLFRQLRWLAWWQALLAGALCAAPLDVLYLSINQGHSDFVGLLNSVYCLGMGAFGGLVVWLAGVFRNPAFFPDNAPWPRSLPLAVPIFAALWFYHQALEPVYLYGCIKAYEPIAAPSDWAAAQITVQTQERETIKASVTIGNADARIVGNCTWLSKRHTPSLQGFDYFIHDVNAQRGCIVPCKNTIRRDSKTSG